MKRRFRLFSLLVVVVSVALSRAPLAQPTSHLPFWAQDRRPIAAIGLFNGTWNQPPSPNRYGLHKCWRRGSDFPETCGGKGGVAWLMDEIQRRYKFGYRRFMLHVPAGFETGASKVEIPSAQWHLLDTAGVETQSGSVTQDLQQSLTPWLAAHADVEVLIYQGLRFNPNLAAPWTDRDMTDSVPPDLTQPFDRLVVEENTRGWLNLRPRRFPLDMPSRSQIGFAFDNTGVESTRDALVAVLEATDLIGGRQRVFVTGEAIPHQNLPAPACPVANLLPEYVSRAPWFGLTEFHLRLDPQRIGLPAWSAPPGSHLGFAVHNREYPLIVNPDGSCHEGADPLSDEVIHDAIRSAYKRGFVIIHYGNRFDAFIRDLYASAR